MIIVKSILKVNNIIYIYKCLKIKNLFFYSYPFLMITLKYFYFIAIIKNFFSIIEIL